MKNLRRIEWVVIFMVITSFLVSCGMTTNVFDPNIPEEKAVTLKIEPSAKLKSYNGIDVNLKTGLGYTGFTIPAGKADFLFDLEIVTSTNAVTGAKTILYVRNVPLSYNFESGKDYMIRCWYTDEDGKVAKTNLGRGLRMSLFICEGDFYNAVHIVKLGG